MVPAPMENVEARYLLKQGGLTTEEDVSYILVSWRLAFDFYWEV